MEATFHNDASTHIIPHTALQEKEGNANEVSTSLGGRVFIPHAEGDEEHLQPTSCAELRWVEGGRRDLGHQFIVAYEAISVPRVRGHVFIPQAEGVE